MFPAAPSRSNRSAGVMDSFSKRVDGEAERATIAAMLIGLDLGSSSVKAVRVGGTGRALRVVRYPVTARRGRDGLVEHDGGAVLKAAVKALSSIEAGSGDRLGI